MMLQHSKGLIIALIAVGLESVAQMFLKVGAAGGPGALTAPYNRWAVRHRWSSIEISWIFAGVFFYLLQIVCYTFVLHYLDLSAAFPISSLCFVGVAVVLQGVF